MLIFSSSIDRHDDTSSSQSILNTSMIGVPAINFMVGGHSFVIVCIIV